MLPGEDCPFLDVDGGIDVSLDGPHPPEPVLQLFEDLPDAADACFLVEGPFQFVFDVNSGDPPVLPFNDGFDGFEQFCLLRDSLVCPKVVCSVLVPVLVPLDHPPDNQNVGLCLLCNVWQELFSFINQLLNELISHKGAVSGPWLQFGQLMSEFFSSTYGIILKKFGWNLR